MLSQRPRILVIEDDTPIGSALDVALRGEDYEVRVEPDGTSLNQIAEQFLPDLVVLDVRLPVGPDGLEMAALLRQRSSLPLLFLTAADSMQERLDGFAAGADDYLIKPFSMAELLARVRALLRRSGRLASSTWQVGDLVVDDDARSVVRSGVTLDLTRTEYDLLAVLARNVGRVLSKSRLLTEVWGFDAYDPNLVEVHMSALRRKLEVHGPRVIHTVRGAGYVLRG
ncbi:MAG: winged helix family two component transcriptional regulator [Frankiales bacterium]|nr:winged helix family two component transcriptional regulator [Frankiales bacterium]